MVTDENTLNGRDQGDRSVPTVTVFSSQSCHGLTEPFLFACSIAYSTTVRMITFYAGKVAGDIFCQLRVLTLAQIFLPNGVAHALTADRGTIATPVSETTSFSFAQYDVTGNFTHKLWVFPEGFCRGHL